MDNTVRSAAGAGAGILALGAIAVVVGANQASGHPAVREKDAVDTPLSNADRAFTNWTSMVASEASELMSGVFEAAADEDREALGRLGTEMMDEFVLWNAESEEHAPDHDGLAQAHALVQQAYTNFGAAGMALADPVEGDLTPATELIRNGIDLQTEATRILVALAA